jgi:hypothetical protein
MRRLFFSLAGPVSLAAALVGGSARGAEEPDGRRDPRAPQPPPTLVWMATQFLPSPEWLYAERRVTFGLGWQITPLLYAYGAQPRVSPVRFFVVEPIVRNSGSSEVFVAPEVVPNRGVGADPLGVGVGVRSTFPLWENGDGLACSLAASYVVVQGEHSPRFEAGLSTLFGVFGIHVAYAPSLFGGTTSWMFRVRYF